VQRKSRTERRVITFLIFGFFEDRFRSVFNRSGYECADTFSHAFGCFRNEVMRGVVQVSGNPMRESFARPSAPAPVTFISHEQILDLGVWK